MAKPKEIKIVSRIGRLSKTNLARFVLAVQADEEAKRLYRKVIRWENGEHTEETQYDSIEINRCFSRILKKIENTKPLKLDL